MRLRKYKASKFNNAKLLAVSILAVVLAACTGTSGVGSAPIDERPQPPSQALRLHLVTSGETLYSIAFRYERDFRQLASINCLGADYTIHLGQRIYLTEAAARDAGIAANNTSVSVVATTRPTRPAAVRPTAPTVTSAPSTPSASQPVPPTLTPVTDNNWVWPQTGPIVRSFGSGDPVSKGIQISAPEGSDVLSAIDGVVVYSGSGLRGYGNLLIIKHDDAHLSAYAYNQELLAQEGDLVRSGQKIATVGSDAEGNNRLYFEIRLDGTPVDPIRYLPER
jgi:lipoprotein NlpD